MRLQLYKVLWSPISYLFIFFFFFFLYFIFYVLYFIFYILYFMLYILSFRFISFCFFLYINFKKISLPPNFSDTINLSAKDVPGKNVWNSSQEIFASTTIYHYGISLSPTLTPTPTPALPPLSPRFPLPLSSLLFLGQPLGLILADTQQHADAAALLVVVTYSNTQTPILTIDV
jgi:hypothetical protein